MKVITLHPQEFLKSCRELRKRFEQKAGRPALTVGIARGGEFVARQFAEPFEPLAVITLQRQGTSIKDNLSENLLAHLPSSLSGLLRKAESGIYHLKWILEGRPSNRAHVMKLSSDLIEKLRKVGRGETIAIVDDAADSGSTLNQVAEAIRLARPDVKVVTAVLTATRRQAYPYTDVALWRDGTLIRFPWSADYKPLPR